LSYTRRVEDEVEQHVRVVFLTYGMPVTRGVESWAKVNYQWACPLCYLWACPLCYFSYTRGIHENQVASGQVDWFVISGRLILSLLLLPSSGLR